MSIAEGVGDFLEVDNRPEIRGGRYKLPDPETGVMKSWTRATTFTKAIDDAGGLTTWKVRKVARGIAMRPELVAQAASLTDADKADLDAVIEQAMAVSGGNEGSGIGTALHSFTARIDAGEKAVEVPAPWDADVAAYRKAIAASPLIVRPEYVERYVVVPSLGVAGQLDRLFELDGLLVVGDLKSGKNLGWVQIAVQLALYAHATHLWNCDTQSYEPMPEIDPRRAIVMHLPVGAGRCDLYQVNIRRGWELAQLCEQVRTARTSKNLAIPLDQLTEQLEASVEPIEQAATDLAARVAWIKSRMKAVRDAGNPMGPAALAKFWPTIDGNPIPTKPAEWTDQHVDLIDALLANIEILDEIGFPPPDPTQPAPGGEAGAALTGAIAIAASDPTLRPIDDDGMSPTTAEADDLKATVAAMRDEHKATLTGWMGQGKRAGRKWTFNSTSTRRIAAINAAAFACVLHGIDPLEPQDETTVRRLIELAISVDLQPAWTTGAVLGSLTLDEAERLTSIATRFAAGDDELCADIGQRLATHFAVLDAALPTHQHISTGATP